MKLAHIISTSQFTDRKHLEKIFSLASRLEKQDKAGKIPQILSGKIIATIFYEPSTRTRLSFEVAVQKLGGQVVSSESAGAFSSAAKGETLEDTIRVLNEYVDGIVLRHSDSGAALLASQAATVPVFNAGDGSGEHPTQALLDVYTMNQEKGSMEKLTISLVGDLLYGRTVHSLVKLLPMFNVSRLYLVAPDSLQMPDDYLHELEDGKIEVHKVSSLEDVLETSDIIYMTRIQKERFKSPADYKRLKGSFILGLRELERMKQDSAILHPLPRVGEIDPMVDNDPRAAYFRQTRNGVYVRMALLHEMYS
jgi:aspartate carbamoyltransferase catalytic subunit